MPPGTGFAELTAGLTQPWGGTFDAFVRGQAVANLVPGLAAFGFGQADLRGGLSAGLGLRGTW